MAFATSADPSGSSKLEFGLSLEDNVLQKVLEEYVCKGIVEGQLPAHDVFRKREEDGAPIHWLVVPFFIKINPTEVVNGEPNKIAACMQAARLFG